MKLDEILKPFRETDPYWYFPRALFLYPSRLDGLPGFHEFMQLLAIQTQSGPITPQGQESILDKLRQRGIMRRDLDIATDYRIHFRNRINLGRKLGFLARAEAGPVRCTEVGTRFVQSPPNHWPEILEHQLARWQLGNPSYPQRYRAFKIFPYVFTLSVLQTVPGNFVTSDEFILRVSLARRHNEKDKVVKWIEHFRGLSASDMESAGAAIPIKRRYAGIVLMALFSCTPSVSFDDNCLALSSPGRAQLIQDRCKPRMHWQDYTKAQWGASFGKLDRALWPLVRQSTKERRRARNRYAKREGSSLHNELKRHLAEHPDLIFGAGTILVAEEYYFPSHDRADLAFFCPDGCWLTAEVEVDIPEGDIVGMLQAIKYKYMCAVQEGVGFEKVRTALIARTIPQDIKDSCAAYGVETYEVAIP